MGHVACAFPCYGPLNSLQASINLPEMSLLLFINLKRGDIKLSVSFLVLPGVIFENCKAYQSIWNESERKKKDFFFYPSKCEKKKQLLEEHLIPAIFIKCSLSCGYQ